MSFNDAHDPVCSTSSKSAAVTQVIEARTRDLGGLTVGRVLPAMARRHVGPFVFFDHMGPADLPAGTGMDVRPHPHVNLATVTYLFEGEIRHRDSLGTDQSIAPGAINWMTAGHGIVHSERTPEALRASGSRLHGLQLWVALPTEDEETAPAFDHYPAEALPSVSLPGGATARVLAGSAYGVTSPVRTRSPLVYVDVRMPAGSSVDVPDAEERAAYVVEGAVGCGEERAEARRMLVFAREGTPRLRAEVDTRLAIVGGAALDGPRHIWWNFVSSSPERIERAKADWREGRFPKVPGDDVDFIPLPDIR
jgi:redox-sensitive bicupin YhaK (pirin superfamily)